MDALRRSVKGGKGEAAAKSGRTTAKRASAKKKTAKAKRLKKAG
jgi:hypothetical protein